MEPDSDDGWDCDFELLRPPAVTTLGLLSQATRTEEFKSKHGLWKDQGTVSTGECDTLDKNCLPSRWIKPIVTNASPGIMEQSLQPGEQNMMLLRLIAAGIKVSDMTCSLKLKRQKKRKHPKTIYMHEGQLICIFVFKFIYGSDARPDIDENDNGTPPPTLLPPLPPTPPPPPPPPLSPLPPLPQENQI
ncbi:hypothetical protein CAPTEDRAFT_193325 [Capitella teleta]|uniref:Uncharacterized protein n=1 Tax=Capitella teleta TaxID=283909 RepID=R7UV35_CAPTE|nr:hypothetical protein CAPTEDRAFT_193325 [Capitella teleta]|eukprot:ELU10030.1 hypothetical protein CAPTEDRAFT_193325 [Capitella teleta]